MKPKRRRRGETEIHHVAVVVILAVLALALIIGVAKTTKSLGGIEAAIERLEEKP